jgi:tetratricopeptide (TPR) repeat protein
MHLSGCANPLNQATYYRYIEQGDKARAEGNWEVAEFAYSRALTNVGWGNLPPKDKSEALYNLGETKQVLGKYDESATYLQQGLAIDEELYGPDGLATMYTLGSLAITYYKQNRIDEGVELLHRIEAAYPKYSNKHTHKFKKEAKRLFSDYTEKLLNRGDKAEAERLETFASSIIVKEN